MLFHGTDSIEKYSPSYVLTVPGDHPSSALYRAPRKLSLGSVTSLSMTRKVVSGISKLNLNFLILHDRSFHNFFVLQNPSHGAP